MDGSGRGGRHGARAVRDDRRGARARDRRGEQGAARRGVGVDHRTGDARAADGDLRGGWDVQGHRAVARDVHGDVLHRRDHGDAEAHPGRRERRHAGAPEDPPRRDRRRHHRDRGAAAADQPDLDDARQQDPAPPDRARADAGARLRGSGRHPARDAQRRLRARGQRLDVDREPVPRRRHRHHRPDVRQRRDADPQRVHRGGRGDRGRLQRRVGTRDRRHRQRDHQVRHEPAARHGVRHDLAEPARARRADDAGQLVVDRHRREPDLHGGLRRRARWPADRRPAVLLRRVRPAARAHRLHADHHAPDGLPHAPREWRAVGV